ncbi:hypothetical protein GGF32_005443 [Allomyces javanicus]|nr:hypothetical protein GGF32_005443 [Allomyces javanicus]
MPITTQWTFKFNAIRLARESRPTQQAHGVEDLQTCFMRLLTLSFGRQAALDKGNPLPTSSTGPVEPTEPATNPPRESDTAPQAHGRAAQVTPPDSTQAQEQTHHDNDHPRAQPATPPLRFDPTALAPLQCELRHLEAIQHHARAKYVAKHAELTRALRAAEGKLARARDWVGQLPRLFSVAGADADIEEDEGDFARRRQVRALAQHAAVARARVVRLRASYQDHMQQWIAREELLRRLLREVPVVGQPSARVLPSSTMPAMNSMLLLATVALLVAHAHAQFDIDDDFTAYDDGTDAAPALDPRAFPVNPCQLGIPLGKGMTCAGGVLKAVPRATATATPTTKWAAPTRTAAAAPRAATTAGAVDRPRGHPQAPPMIDPAHPQVATTDKPFFRPRKPRKPRRRTPGVGPQSGNTNTDQGGTTTGAAGPRGRSMAASVQSTPVAHLGTPGGRPVHRPRRRRNVPARKPVTKKPVAWKPKWQRAGGKPKQQRGKRPNSGIARPRRRRGNVARKPRTTGGRPTRRERKIKRKNPVPRNLQAPTTATATPKQFSVSVTPGGVIRRCRTTTGKTKQCTSLLPAILTDDTLVAYSFPRVHGHAAIRTVRIPTMGYTTRAAVLQRRDRVVAGDNRRLVKFGFQTARAILPAPRTRAVARVRVKTVPPTANGSGAVSLPTCTVRDAIVSLYSGTALVAAKVFPGSVNPIPEGKWITVEGSVNPVRGQPRVAPAKLAVEVAVRYNERECFDLARVDVAEFGLCTKVPAATK